MTHLAIWDNSGSYNVKSDSFECPQFVEEKVHGNADHKGQQRRYELRYAKQIHPHVRKDIGEQKAGEGIGSVSL